MVRAVQVRHRKFDRCILGVFTGRAVSHVEHFAVFLVVDEWLPKVLRPGVLPRRGVILPTPSRSGALYWTGPLRPEDITP
jgi:hypothetical protein